MDNCRQLIAKIYDISTIPTLQRKILSVACNDDSSPQDLYELIAHDKAFAERVLRVANSVFFGHSGEIKDIKHSIMFLGYDRIKSIAIGITVMDMFSTNKSFNVKNLWIHGYEVAYIAASISDIIPSATPSENFLCGLLHDIGRVIFYQDNPKRFLEIGTCDDMFDKERATFGCTHADAGGLYSEHIGLPEDIVLSIRYHHDPSNAPGNKLGVSIVSLAEAFSRQFSPRTEDDGIWTKQHDVLCLELSISEHDISNIKENFLNIKHEIDTFFD